MKKILIPVLLVIVLAGCNRMTGRGEKVGTVIKLSQEGYFFKTWEGEMVRGGMNNGSGAFSTKPLHFTIDNPDLLPLVQKAFEEQKEVVATFEGHTNVVFSTTSECNDENGGGNCKYLTSIRER
jgi:hypothetical protein